MYISGDNPCLSCIFNNPQKIKEIFINSEKSNIYKQIIEKHKLNGITRYLPKRELLKINKEDKRSSNNIIIRREKYTSVSLSEIVTPKPKNSLIILIDQLNDQNNLGNIIRTSSLIGADGIVIPEHSSAQINNTTSTTSSGAIEVLKFNISKNISRTLEELKKLGYWTYSLDMTGEILTKKFNFDIKLIKELILENLETCFESFNQNINIMKTMNYE